MQPTAQHQTPEGCSEERNDRRAEAKDESAQSLTPEQAHWLAIEEKARELACRSGSCGG